MNKERIEYLEDRIQSLKTNIKIAEARKYKSVYINEAKELLKFFEEWLEDLKADEWIDGKIPPKEDGSYLCRTRSNWTGFHITDCAEYIGEWKIGNNWDLIEYRKIPKGSDE